MLPFLEQQSEFDLLNFNMYPNDLSNPSAAAGTGGADLRPNPDYVPNTSDTNYRYLMYGKIVATPNPAYSCPSDSGPNDIRYGTPTGQSGRWAFGSYRGVSGRTDYANWAAGGTRGYGFFDFADSYGGLPTSWAGVFRFSGGTIKLTGTQYYGGERSFGGVDFATIEDGTSNTVMFIEHHYHDVNTDRGTFWGNSRGGINIGVTSRLPGMLSVEKWKVCVAGASDTPCYRAAGSYHPGGINAGYADGSVHFVTETISGDVWTVQGAMGDAGLVALP
jgi:prepilin-type processing-associated H-X9-DG protein